jgi:hypothetical protein
VSQPSSAASPANSANRARVSKFPTEMEGFPQAGRSTSQARQRGILLAIANKGFSGACMFALAGHLCYSNQAVDEQWSLPVAARPAP